MNIIKFKDEIYMKVVLLAPTPPPNGGIAGWTIRMLQSKLKNGWKVVVVDEKTIKRKDAYDTSFRVITEVKRCLNIWNDLRKALLEDDVEVVQACIPARSTSMLREIISGIITKKKKKKFILHFRCTVPNMITTRIQKLIFKKLVFIADCVFVLNRASLDFVNKTVPGMKCELIPNFINSEEMDECKVHNKKLNRIVYVGGVNKNKGCDLIAEIAKELKDKEFLLIGNVDMDVNVFPSNVKLIGEQPRNVVQSKLNDSDAFIFLTRYRGEGFSNALAEAMAHSLPCVVSDWAANADMIENKGGIVLKHYSVQDAVQAIRQMEDPRVRKEMGDWNRNKVLNSYSDKVITDMYVDAYEKLLV